MGETKERLEQIFRDYYQLIYRVAFSQVKNHADAEDITQEVFLKIIRHDMRYQSMEHERAWIVRVTINLCRDLLKSKWHKTSVSMEEVSEAQGILPFFSVAIPPLMNVMTALVLAFTLGLGLAQLKNDTLKNAARDFQDIIVRMISAVILPLLPIYIFGIFLNMTHSGQVFSILMVFIKIIGVIFLLHIFLLVFQYCIAALFVRKNPFKLLGRMLPAYFTALGTQSSAATIPVTLEQTKKNGVSPDIAGFVIPLCATIHLSGSTLKIVACALALMMMQGISFDFPLFAGFIFMLGITMVAAPGVPGGAIMASLGILQSMLGFDESAQALMIALYIAMDSFGTACNVTGDGAIALVVDKIYK